jgi:hypothetical protein
MKTSKKYFERFKAEFLRWQKELGLTQYRIDFFHEKLDCLYAAMTVWEKEKAARVSLATEISKDSAKIDPGPEEHARHEVLHLLIHRLSWLGGCRYITDDDLHEESEAIVVRLEKVLK